MHNFFVLLLFLCLLDLLPYLVLFGEYQISPLCNSIFCDFAPNTCNHQSLGLVATLARSLKILLLLSLYHIYGNLLLF